MAKGYSKKSTFDYEETFSSVAMIKSIRILISIVSYYNYEIWQMDVKTSFLNDYLEENIYMMQPNGFIIEGQQHMVCKFHKSKRFVNVIKSFSFDQNEEEPCVYRKIQDDILVLLIFMWTTFCCLEKILRFCQR